MKNKKNTASMRSPSDSPTPKKPFEALKGAFGALSAKVQRGVAAAGYVTTTPIQEQCITHVLQGRDVLGTAQTGTGKTAAFTLPLLDRLAADARYPQRGAPRALILAPTRELAAQIGESIGKYARFLHLSHTVIFGGVSQLKQVKALHRGVDILVATPGRLLDLMEQGYIQLDKTEVFILDEVDRMLDMGFLPDIKRVMTTIPKKRQTLFFSATMDPKMEKLACTMVQNPVQITIVPDRSAEKRIAQKVMYVSNQNKNVLLASLLNDSKMNKAIVFTQMKHAADRVVDALKAVGVLGTAIHGNKSQNARAKALAGFKRGQFRVLVATDVAARGIDVEDITHVINYDMPVEAQTYIHRIGRTARAGAAGDAISFCSSEDRAYLNNIERLLGKQMDVDMQHAYHCPAAFRSTMPAPKGFGAGNRSSGGSKSKNRNSNKSRSTSGHKSRSRGPRTSSPSSKPSGGRRGKSVRAAGRAGSGGG